MMSMAGSSSSTNNASQEYDVFLSFRGEDTRYNLISHLKSAFSRKKINAFIDENMDRGVEISPFLLNTIEASKISVIIFSRNYASSRWCLRELEQILHCKETKGQIVLPIFYHIDPSDVRNQIGSFSGAFSELEKHSKVTPDMLERWKTCLNEAANLSGWTIDEKKPESLLVDETVNYVLMMLDKLSPIDFPNLVGIESTLNDILVLLHKGSNGVSKIGIWGMGGVGKTTIARVVFMKIFRYFEGSYFAENVRDEWEKNNGLNRLRNELLSKLLGDRYSNIELNLTRRRLKHTKVLIVFDDVTSFEQIEKLIENFDWLSSESQIIITSRDKHVLKNCRVDDAFIYEVRGLRGKEARELFNRYALEPDSPIDDYMVLSSKVIEYTKGLPLALKVFGSHLYSRGEEFWKSEINKLGKVSHPNIQNVLKVSYDGLARREKKLFLDIACFLKGEQRDSIKISKQNMMKILIDKCLVSVTYRNIITMHDLFQEMGREIAREETCRYIWLWDHKDIEKTFTANKEAEAVRIRSISLDISKLCNGSLDCRVLSKMSNLKFFRVYSSQGNHESWLRENTKMPNVFMRLIGLFSSQDNHESKLEGFQHLQSFSNRLAFFSWHEYPFKSMPKHFPSSNLVRLHMPYNNVKCWNVIEDLVNLEHVDLSFSKHMTKIPNLSRVSNLQTLILRGCSSLLEITPSSNIQNLNKLVTLDLSKCEKLISLPDGIQSELIDLSSCYSLEIAPKISCKVEELDLSKTAIRESPFIESPSSLRTLRLFYCRSLETLSSSICNLKFLEILHLEGCSNLEALPDDFGDLEALFELSTARTVIKNVPSSILHLPKLGYLYIDRMTSGAAPLNWKLNSSSGSSSLTDICLDNCQLTELPDNLGQLSCLRELSLSGNNLESIPEDIIKGFSKLCYLNVSSSERLQSLPKNLKDLPTLSCLIVKNCRRLQLLPELPIGISVNACDCSSLQSISDLSFLLLPEVPLRTTTFANCSKLDLLTILHEGQECCREFCANICFPGNEIPKWFTFQSRGSYIALDRSLDWHNKNLLGFLASAVIAPGKFDGYEFCDIVSCYSLVKGRDDHVLFGFCSIMHEAFRMCPPDEYQEISSMMKSINCKVLIKFHPQEIEVKKCGIHFLYVEDYGEPLETSRRSVDNARKKGAEKEKDELQSNKLQISNPFDDDIFSLRPRFASDAPDNLHCLEAQYWKLKRNALREIVKTALLNNQQNSIIYSEVEEMNCVNPKGCMGFPGSEIPEWFTFQNVSDYIEIPEGSLDYNLVGLVFCGIVEFPHLLDLGQPFFINCEMRSNHSYEYNGIGCIQGQFEGDRTHYIKSDHIFLGYDCVFYRYDEYHWVSYKFNTIIFYVTNRNGVRLEGCKVKKCGVRFLFHEDFENKWQNPIDLSSLKRRLKLNINGLSAARDGQSRSSDLNEMVGSMVIDTTEPQSKILENAT